MLNSRTAVLAVSLAALAAGGCTSSRFSSADSAPPPLAPAPAGQVMNQQLPPPATPQTAADALPPQGTQVAAIPPAAAANAPDVTAGSVAGVWNATVSGQTCKVATPQTKFGQGFRAGPLRCPAPIDGVKSWNVSGKQLTLYDETGGTLARLYSTGPEKFDGQTTSGVPISLAR